MAPLENTVVVGVDGSAASTGAVAYAAHTAATRRIPLLLVTSYTMPAAMFAEGMVPPQPVYDELERECLPIIESAKATALKVAPEIQVGHAVVEGNPAQVLIDYSRKAKLIVLGSRGLGGIKGMVLGSVSAAVASHAFCPVVVTRTDTDSPDSTGPVVVGIDGSEISAKATDWAFAEASARGAELIAVHTWMDMQVQASLAGLSAAQQQWQVVEEEQNALLGQRLAGWSERFPDVKVTKVVTRDRPVRALADASEGAQLLVVGSHGRGGFKGMLLGSTSRALLQAAPCPMMVVRPDSLPK